MDTSFVRPETSSAEILLSSSEKERASVKKREARGSKEEKKKRKLILSDSESDGDRLVVSCRSGSPDRNVGDGDGAVAEEFRTEGEDAGGGMEVTDGPGGGEKREPEVLASEAVARRGDGDGSSNGASDKSITEEDGRGEKVQDGSGGQEKRAPEVSASGDGGGSNGAPVEKKESKCWLILERERRMRDAAAGLKMSSSGSGAPRNKIDSCVKEKDMHAERKTASRSSVLDKGGGGEGDSRKKTPSAEAKRASKSKVKPIRKERKLEEKRVWGPEVRKKKEAGEGAHLNRDSGDDLSGEDMKVAGKRIPRSDTKAEGGSRKSAPTTSEVHQDGEKSNIAKAKVAKERVDLDGDKKVLDVSRSAQSGKNYSVEKTNGTEEVTVEEDDGNKKVLHVSGVDAIELEVQNEFIEKGEADGTNNPASIDKQDSKKCQDDNGTRRNGIDSHVKKESGDGPNREKEMNMNERMVSRSDLVDEREGGESESCKKTPSSEEAGEGDRCKKSPSSEVTGKKKPISKSQLAKREERRSEAKRASRLEGCKEVKRISKKEGGDGNKGACQNGSPNKKKDLTYGLSIEKEIKVEARRVSRPEAKKEAGSCKKTSKVTKKRVDAGGDKEVPDVSGAVHLKKIKTENKEIVSDRKRSRETVETETRAKKLKSEDDIMCDDQRWIQRSGARTLRKLKDKVLSSDKKVRSLEKGHIHKGHEQNKKRAPKHPSISGEGKFIEKKNLKKRRADHKSKEGHEPKFETCLSTEQNADEAASSGKQHADATSGKVRLTDKQKVSEQIKKILLDAGWEIDLRPRRGRDYKDSVYIPPFGGAGYWSVTKAYNVYLERCKSENDEKNKSMPENSAIPTDLVSMLKRNVINKRRKKIEKDENREKLGGRKKGKGFTSKKDSNNKKGKSEGKVTKKMDRGADKLRKKATEIASVCSAVEKPHLRARNQNQRGCALLVRGADQDAETDLDDYVPYAWKRTVLSWMIDLGILHANEKVKYINDDKSQEVMEGWITRDGIRCSCCSKIITVSKFEIHADSKLCQPYQNMYVENTGISLLQCLLNAWEKERSEHLGFHRVNIEGDDPNDDTCGLCGDGGDLICCDCCPSTFHLKCLGIERLPSGDWHCTNCSCKFCGLVSDPTSEGSSTLSPVLTCSQCERKYHQECIPEKYHVSVGHDIPGTSFCGQSCCMVFEQLQKLLGIKNDLEAGLSWRLIRRLDKDSSKHQICLPQWAECNSKSAVAFAVMDECFLPIIDKRSGINLIHNIVYNYGSNIDRLSYKGFYTFILEREDEIITAASVRIHGTTLAEMPFIGTRNMYRRQGMCRQLLSGIESALYSLDVEKLIIPAISELKETWVNVFGFMPLEQSQKQEIGTINMLVFPGTGLLLKPIPKKESVEHNGNPGRDNEAYVQSSLCSSDEVAYSRHEVKDVDIVVPKTENFGVSHESECQDPKSSEAAVDVDLFVQTEVVYHDELIRDDEFQITSKEPKAAVSCVGTVHPDHKVDSEDAAVADGISLRQSTIVDPPQSLLAGNRSPVLSSFESNLASDEEVVVYPEHEIKVLEHKRDDSSNTYKSECQALDCKSSETAILKHFNSEPAGRDVFQTNSSNELKIGLPCESTLNNSHAEKE